jgi:hypothetical protein
MNDEELLSALVESGGRLLHAAVRQSEAQFGTKPDDPRWPYPFPLRSELQLKHLFVQTADALDVALMGLRARTSAVSIGAVRFLAEGLVVISWLSEPTEEPERRKRAYRFVLGGIDRTRRMLAHTDNADPSTIRELTKSVARLREIAEMDGIQHLKEPPKAEHLFRTYLSPGYVVFSTMSEIGSHPGLLQILIFHQDRTSKLIQVDVGGQHGERAAWVNGAFDLFGRTCDRIGQTFGWDEWLQDTVMPIVKEAVPLMKEAGDRWRIRWGLEPSPGVPSEG